jgi:hypothetical protein
MTNAVIARRRFTVFNRCHHNGCAGARAGSAGPAIIAHGIGREGETAS